jgi:hypothetical protein
MNSICKVAVIVWILSVTVFSDPSLYVGGGLNISSTTATDSLSATKSPRKGFNVTFGFEQSLTKYISLISGFSVETRGEKTKSTTDIGDATGSIISVIESDINLLYLQIPVFAQCNLPLGPGKINLFAGPEMGILLVGKLQSVDNTTIPSTGIALPAVYDTLDLAKKMKLADGGISFGIGYEITVGKSAFFLRPSYYLGLTDYFADGPKGGLRNIKLLAGYKFTFTK